MHLQSKRPNRLATALTLAVALSSTSLTTRLSAQDTTDTQHYKLEIELDFTAKTITGKNTATFQSTIANLASIQLDLATSLTVNSVQMNTKAVSFSRNGTVMTITLDRPYLKDELFTVEIDYSGTPSSGGFGGFQWVTHGTAASPMAWTLSEPWYSYTWWPVKETLTDKATSEIWVTHPDTMTAASNGSRLGIDTLSGNRLRTRWKTAYPIAPYLMSLAVTNYQTRTDTYTHLGANMPVEFYVFPENFASWQSGMNQLVPMLTAFSNVYGQYPFVNEKYGIAQFTWGGGMEHQTITSQSSVSEYLCAHELSHHWWGDNITCATWHDIWLNEGFATFSEAIWAENKPGGSLATYLTKIRGTRPSSTSGTVYVYNATSTNAVFSTTNVYNKGSWVLHQLRHVLGDAVFFKALLDYRAAFQGKSATTADFRASCEKTSGMDLGWFFDECVMNGGAPTYRTSSKFVQRNGTDYLYLQIEQRQTTPSLFVMPLDVVVQTTSGPVTQVVWDDERIDEFTIRLPGAGTSYALDPDQWVLRGTTSTGTYTTPFFAADAESVDVTAGGSSGLHMDFGTSNAGRSYLVAMSMSGTSPGVKLGAAQIPLNPDALTELGLQLLNTSVFAGFLGSLDAQGMGDATFALPPAIAAAFKGTTLNFATILVDRFDFASRPVGIKLR
ncbi:MAG: M1 family metallopeptidase [Planctomycetes bacterium]|nr:M1 family metallopeptidase [Planctomycetota bacterium]